MAVKILANKKAIFYTILSILFVGLAVFVLTSDNDSYSESKEFTVIATRVNTMNDFTEDMSDDLERAVYITGIRSLNAVIGYIIDEGKFVDHADVRFKEAFVNGTVYGKKQPLMENSTFPDWQNRVKEQGSKKGIAMSITMKNLTILHVSPWDLNITGNFIVNVTDTANTAKWSRIVKSTTQISVVGFEDPAYVIGSFGRVANVVRKTPFYGQFTTGSGASFNPANLLNHTLEGYYINNSRAPSFLMRLENNYSASKYGIESLVNLIKVQNQGLPVETKDIVGYIYWSSQNPASYKVNKLPTWIRLDSDRFSVYMVTGETYS